MKYQRNRNVVWACRYHVVWCPKYRRRVLEGPIADRLNEIIHEVCGEREIGIIAMEIMPDHVQLLIDVDPQFGVHKAIKQIKGRSSHILREEFPELKSRIPSLWTNSYFVSTAGGAPVERIKEYIENQKNV